MSVEQSYLTLVLAQVVFLVLPVCVLNHKKSNPEETFFGFMLMGVLSLTLLALPSLLFVDSPIQEDVKEWYTNPRVLNVFKATALTLLPIITLIGFLIGVEI